MEKPGALTGPYRATILWNDLIRSFRAGIPLGRHRRYMKTYDDCFVASDAISWLHQHLKKNPNFGSDVSRTQSVQLLQKLHRARVFEDVRGSKHNRADFSDGSRLFRLTHGSPLKAIRTPLALRTNLKLANKRILAEPVTKPDGEKLQSAPCLPGSTLPECHFITKPLTPHEMEEEWKTMTLLNLQRVLGVENLDDILDSQLVSGRHIMHNCLYVNKSGVVTNIEPQDQLPHWALSAMKCLAYWPEKIDQNLPNYPGFEKDVFKVVRDYFCSLPEPLMTYEMYEVLTNVFVKAERGNETGQSSANLCNNSTPKGLNTFNSVENLLLNLTVSKVTPPHQSMAQKFINARFLDLSPIEPVSENSCVSRGQGSNSSLNHPVTKYETAFGPDNRTVTRVYFADGIATDFGHNCDSVETEHTPIETHFETSPEEVKRFGFYRQNDEQCLKNEAPFTRAKSTRERRINHQKCERRRSAGNSEDTTETYGCTVGVYSSGTYGNINTPVTHSEHPVIHYRTRHASASPRDRGSATDLRPPVYKVPPPSYDSLYPESLYPDVHHHPVINGAQRLKRNKSLSSASLHKVKQQKSSASVASHNDSVHGCMPTDRTGYVQGVMAANKDSVPGRSLSLSDLTPDAKPVENGLREHSKFRPSTESTDSLDVDVTEERIRRALQLVCLLLPPPSRRKLHLLLRLMSKIEANHHLALDNTQSVRNLLLSTFHRAILSCQDEADMDELLVYHLVAFLLDNYVDILAIPADLKSQVEDRLTRVQRTRVTIDEYENQRLSNSQRALADLLEDIVSDMSMSVKDKKKRLKQFQKLYPEIYAHRFPSSQSEAELFRERPKIKQPLLVKPLLKLRGLRI